MRFKKIYIELTDFCALKCSFCPSAFKSGDGDAGFGRRGVMSLNLFNKICQEAKNLAETISLHVLGDPLSLNNLADYVAIASENGLKIDLVTTGMFLKNHDFKTLINPPFHQISFSLSAFLNERNRNAHNPLMQILDFCAFNISCDSPIFINLRIQDSDLSGNGASELIAKIADFFKSDLSEISSGRSHKMRLAKKTFLNIKPTFKWPSGNGNFANSVATAKTCYALKDHFAILSNGVVVPCCLDYLGAINLGDANEQSLNETLTSKRAVKIRAGFAKNIAVEAFCAHCGFIHHKSKFA